MKRSDCRMVWIGGKYSGMLFCMIALLLLAKSTSAQFILPQERDADVVNAERLSSDVFLIADTTREFCGNFRDAVVELRTLSDTAEISSQREAVSSYFNSLSSDITCEVDIDALNEELRLAELISDQPITRIRSDRDPLSREEISVALTEFWANQDPTPSRVVNERLIEHQKRVHYASERYSQSGDSWDIDARGEIYIRYGEPDQRFQAPTQFSRSDLFGFMSDFESTVTGYPRTASNTGWRGEEDDDDLGTFIEKEEENRDRRVQPLPSFRNRQWDAKWRADELENRIASNPFQNDLMLYIYRGVGVGQTESMVFFFSGDDRYGYRLIDSPDEWIPTGLYRRSGSLSVAPALPLQYLLYSELSRLDRSLMDAYNHLERVIFHSPVPLSAAQLGQLALQTRILHTQNNRLKRVNREASHSSIPGMLLRVYPYRTIGSDGEPSWIAFIETDTAPLLNRFAAEQMVFEDMNEPVFYRMEKGADLMRDRSNHAGRFRVQTDPGADGIARTIFKIPHIETDSSLIRFYTGLYRGGESRGGLIASGRTEITISGGFDGFDHLFLSDLIMGRNKIEPESDLYFPFRPVHDGLFMQGEPIVIHFEVFGLELNSEGRGEFEAEYRFEPNERRRGWFRRGLQKQSGVIEFETGSKRFSESLELENLNLSKGSYLLSWIVTDKTSGKSVERSREITIAE